MDPLVASAQFIDLDRRLRALELALGRGAPPEYCSEELCSLYLHAVSAQAPTLQDARLWITVARSLSVEDFAKMATSIRDPFPWRPFLTRLDHLEAHGLHGVRPATAHLLKVAEGLLQAQGLGGIVAISDIVAGPTATERALRAISVKKESSHDRLRRRKHPKAQGPRSRS